MSNDKLTTSTAGVLARRASRGNTEEEGDERERDGETHFVDD